MVPCSRPSSMKGISRYSSSIARHAVASNGFFSMGSSTTLSPTLLTRTSVPSKWNSLGRRTAWLRPCINSLAVALMIRFLQNGGRYHWYISRNQRICQFIQQRPKAGFGGQERGEVKEALHRQSILPRQFLERHLRSRADVLDHFGRRERAEPSGI